MAMSSFIPGLPNDIVEQHIMPKVIKPILDIKVHVSMPTLATLMVDLATINCIFKYKGVNREWANYISKRSEYNSMRLTMHEECVEYGHKFTGTKGVLWLHDMICKICHELAYFEYNTSYSIAYYVDHSTCVPKRAQHPRTQILAKQAPTE